jgi:uncharacterized BrkB/YihY/UPF0761 family membrane protein
MICVVWVKGKQGFGYVIDVFAEKEENVEIPGSIFDLFLFFFYFFSLMICT